VEAGEAVPVIWSGTVRSRTSGHRADLLQRKARFPPFLVEGGSM